MMKNAIRLSLCSLFIGCLLVGCSTSDNLDKKMATEIHKNSIEKSALDEVETEFKEDDEMINITEEEFTPENVESEQSQSYDKSETEIALVTENTSTAEEDSKQVDTGNEQKESDNSKQVQVKSASDTKVSINTAVTKINVLNGNTGEEKVIDDAGMIDNIVTALNEVSVEKQETGNRQGYLYLLQFYNNETLVKTLMIRETSVEMDGITYQVESTKNILINIE